MSTTRCQRFDRLLRTFLSTMSFIIVPLVIFLVAVIALVFWQNPYKTATETNLPLRVIQPAGERVPEQARLLLREASPIREFETRLSERPVWFLLSLEPPISPDQSIELPSRHAMELICWNAATLERIGAASKSHAEGALAPVKAGFVLHPTAAVTEVLCRGRFVGPARLSANLVSDEQLAKSDRHFYKKMGLLDGGMIALAAFALVISLVNRERMYLLFSVWLLLNWRVAGLSTGWDAQLLGQIVPEPWVHTMRAVTISLYGLVTLELYFTLFKEHIKGSLFAFLLRLNYYAGIPLLVIALTLPYRVYIPFMWLVAGSMHVLMMGSLGTILRRTRSRVALWYVASFVVSILATLSEIVAAALGVRELTGVINNVTSAFASSLLASIAVAESLWQEHVQRLDAQKELEHTYEAMPVGLFTLDTHGRLLSANPALTRMLGLGIHPQLQDISLLHYFEPGAWTTLFERVNAQRDAELELLSKDASRRYLVKATLARNKIEGFIQDITEKAKATEELLFMVNHDPLTKVANRRGIELFYRDAIGALAAGGTLSFAYLDLNRFKLINELFGHTAGDEVLIQVCARINPMLASNHGFARVGGDEFVIVMPGTSVSLARIICQGIVSALGDTPYRVGDKEFQLGVAIGLVEISAGTSLKNAMSVADKACRDAKNKQGDGLVVFESSSAALSNRQADLDLVERLSAADATEYLYLEMQPIMSFRSPADSLNVEVLLRMRDHDGSVIPAGRVIGAAEKGGLTGMIDRWVLSTTLQWIETNRASLTRTRFVTMNLNGASLNDARFIHDALSILERHPFGAKVLCIEITESVALHDLDNTRRFIDQVRRFGTRVALDDFGAGYTSFSYLKELPADVLKIDGQFIVNINDHPANVAIVEAIVNLAINLGMKTIAEWAEDAATARTLAEIGVDYVQGFVVARSQPAEKILAARSAASFIQDVKMLALVQELTDNPETVGMRSWEPAADKVLQ